MDKQQLIESGLIELYVLGTTTKAEERELLPHLEDPQVKKVLSKVEIQLEQLGLENSIDPPSFIKENILKAIDGISEEEVKKISTSNHSIGLETQLRKWQNNFKIAAAMAGLLALGFGWQLFSNNNINEVSDRMASMEQQIEKLSSSNSVITDQLAYINHTYTTPIVLKGTQVSPNSKAVVYWNPKVDEALLSTNGLPELSDNQVYQIWADIDNEMVSMKVFTVEEKLVTLPFMSKASSLNITVEPKGGSDHPNVEQLYVNASTKSS